VAVWHSKENPGIGIGNDFDIFSAASTDGGLSWGDPVVVNSTAPGKGGDDRLPDIATDGFGRFVAAWHSKEDLDGAGGDSDIHHSVSTDLGATWSPTAFLKTTAATDSGRDARVDVETDGFGNWVAVWDSKDNLGGTIATDPDVLASTSTDDGATWLAPIPVNDNAGAAAAKDQFARLATDRAGTWVAVWQSKKTDNGFDTDFDVFSSTSTDNGLTWTPAIAADTTATGPSSSDNFPIVETDANGRWLAAWHSNNSLSGTIGDDNDILCAFSTDAGQTWTAPEALHNNAVTDEGSDRHVASASNGGTAWVTAWRSNEDLGGIDTDIDEFVTKTECLCPQVSCKDSLESDPVCGGFCPEPQVCGDFSFAGFCLCQ